MGGGLPPGGDRGQRCVSERKERYLGRDCSLMFGQLGR